MSITGALRNDTGDPSGFYLNSKPKAPNPLRTLSPKPLNPKPLNPKPETPKPLNPKPKAPTVPKALTLSETTLILGFIGCGTQYSGLSWRQHLTRLYGFRAESFTKVSCCGFRVQG